MNAQEITEVRRTWELASTRLPLLSRLFCSRMQLIARHHGPLFGDDAETSARLILRLVGIAVNGLNQPRVLFPLLNTLGAQNARRIINARQNWVVIHALLWAIKAALGPSFNSSVRHAWIACCRAVTQAMEAGIADAGSGNRWTARTRPSRLASPSTLWATTSSWVMKPGYGLKSNRGMQLPPSGAK